MKIAFLVLAHQAPRLLAKVVAALEADGDDVFVHIDKSSEISPFIENLLPATRARFINGRFAVTWGGFNMVRATNALIDTALAADEYDYFYLLSGQDYPIRPHSWLKKLLQGGHDFMECAPMPSPTKPLSRLQERIIKTKSKWVRYRIRCLAEKLLNLLPPPDFERTFGMAPYAGASWWCLRRNTVEYIRAYAKQTPAYDKFMRWTLSADEMYYQTLVRNGPNPLLISDTLTGTIWVQGNAHPEIIDLDNLQELLKRQVFLVRKFSTEDFTALDYASALAHVSK